MNASPNPQKTIRSVIDACTDCDVCRYLMPSECLLFDDLYKLHDREADGGDPIASSELRRLVELCNYCGLCSCPDIRAAIIEAKTDFVEREGLPLGIRLMVRLEQVAKIGRLFPKLAKAILLRRPLEGLVKRISGIHTDRNLPPLPDEPFPDWAARKGICQKPPNRQHPKVAYFAGCTGRHLFPNVPRAVVKTFQRCGIEVYYPEQHCCGMPTLVEGDRRQTLAWVRSTVDRLAGLAGEGFAIVCSCPTCGYMLKTVVRDRADYADARQAMLGGDDRFLLVPDDRCPTRTGERPLKRLSKSIYGRLLRDDGYFASIDAIQRIRIAEQTFDAGEYLLERIRTTKTMPVFKQRFDRLVYFVPCHQREQQIGRPYLELLRSIPGLSMEIVDGPYDCCGMGGNMGFKKSYHQDSIRLASPVLEKMRNLAPDAIVTDCLSCRLQFLQTMAYPVYHPMEILEYNSR